MNLLWLIPAYILWKLIAWLYVNFPPNSLWKLWWNITRGQRKKSHIRGALFKSENKIWENEFLKHQIWEVRGSMREQYDWLRERVEGAIRRIAENKWQFFYSESGDEVKVMDMPLPPRELASLPDKPTKPHRFHKKERAFNSDKEAKDAVTTIEELERVVEKREPDLKQQKQQLQGIDQKVAEIDGAINGTYELKKNLLSMLRKL